MNDPRNRPAKRKKGWSFRMESFVQKPVTLRDMAVKVRQLLET